MDAQNSNGLAIRTLQLRQTPGLPNQGQIDWIALANTTVSASVSFLSRMSSAGVDHFTVAVGQAVASNFRMSPLGMHRLDKAIKNLHYVPGIDEALWLGFGINHIVRSMTQTTEGATCLMLCSALSESRTTLLSARVMYELMNTYSSSSSEAANLTPSLRQWKSLVEVSTGCLSTTPFGTVVDQMVDLIYSSENNIGSRYRLVGNPKHVARVVHALGKLSQGQVATLTISGDCDCGWIAAVAYWFFDIAVEICDARNQIVYPMGKLPAPPDRKLIIALRSLGSSSLQLVGESYKIENIGCELILPLVGRSDDDYLQTRIPWGSVLSQSFEDQGSALLRSDTDFAAAVGSAARILRDCVLPQKSFAEAVNAFQSAQERLLLACQCRNCKVGRAQRRLQVTGDFCLPVICRFIIQFALDLSATSIPASLLSCRSGIEDSYEESLDISRLNENDASRLFDNWSIDGAMQRMMWQFTDFKPDQSPLSEKLAFVHNGLCFYNGALRRLSDKPEEMTCIHIVSILYTFVFED